MTNEDTYKIIVSVILVSIAILPTSFSGYRVLNPAGALLKGLGITLFKDEESYVVEERSIEDLELLQGEEKQMQVTHSYDVGLVNEISGTGGHLCAAGIVIILGAFIEKLTTTSIIMAFVTFFGFLFARLLRICLDGNPGKKVIQGAIIELIF
eukprot:196612_1